MAITYPRLLPSFLKATDSVLRLVKGTTSAVTRGGGVQTVQSAQPYWDFQWTSPALTRVQKAQLTAWWDSLRGGLKTFLAYDPSMPFPSYYASEEAVLALLRSNGLAFDGTFSLSLIKANELRSVGSSVAESGMDIDFIDDSYTVNTTASTDTLRPPSNFRLTAGDLISVTQDGRYSLHRVVESTKAWATGNFGSGNPILIEPAITTSLFTAGTAIANVVKPLAEFVPDDSRFDATQTLNASPATIAGFSKVIY